MRIAISGGRDYPRREQVVAVLLELDEEDEVIVGDCPTGVDEIVRTFFAYGLRDPHVYVADWSLGPRGGPKRNEDMIRGGEADLLIAFDNGGPGTKSALDIAKRWGVSRVRITP